MNLSIRIKSFISHLLFTSGITTARILNLSEDNFLVLMYHRIIPQALATEMIEEGMYVTPKTFELHINYLKDNFNVVPAGKIYKNIDKEYRSEKNRPVCIITFDDGWYDFYQYAFPILKKYNLPATVFLPTGFIDTADWFWTDRLSSILSQRSQKSDTSSSAQSADQNILELASKIENLKGGITKRIDTAISLLKKYKLNQIEQVLNELNRRWNISLNQTGRAFLNWREIKEIYTSGLVEFGSHTHMHNLLDTIDEKELLEELKIPISILKEKSIVDPESIYFCYPNGNFNSIIASKVREMGYKMAFTTVHRWVNFNFDPYQMGRIAIHEDMSFSKPMFANRIAGYI